MEYKIVKHPAEGKVELWINNRLEGIIAQESNFLKVIYYLEARLAELEGPKFSLDSDVTLKQGWPAGIYWIGDDQIHGWYKNQEDGQRMQGIWDLKGNDADGDERFNLILKE